MISGFYTGTSGVLYNEQKLGVIANNLANVNSNSFKKSYLMFKTRNENEATHWIDPDVKNRLPTTYGIERKGVYPSFESGSLTPTNNSSNVAIAPELRNAFFAVQKQEKGSYEVYYTRNGQISYAPENPNDPNSRSIIHLGGYQLLDNQGKTIPVDIEEGQITITPNGSIKQKDTLIGNLPIYRMNDNPSPALQRSSPLEALMPMGDALYRIPPNLKDKFYPMPIEVGQAGINQLLYQGFLEESNVNIMSEYVEMMNATKSAEANYSAMHTQASTLTKLFQIVRG
jgi:flagellar basal-body rod protein FlgF